MTVQHDFQDDIDAIGRSKTVPTLLETLMLATGMGFVAVARVTESRWVTCRSLDRISFGLEAGDELDVESTLCNEVRQYDREIVIDDVGSDPIYVGHHCPSRYGFRSYVSLPIRRKDGSFFGTLCAIDPEPRMVKDDQVLSMFRLFAKMIGQVLDTDDALSRSHDALSRSHGELSHERTLAEIQEQFIAILAHDLRNPVNSLTAGLRMMERHEIDEPARDLVELMRASVNRMGLLIENLLDQARKRSGGGIVIERAPTRNLAASLRQIIAELQPVAPDQPIDADLDLDTAVVCDLPRVSQLFSNLLANAITHGSGGMPVEVGARATPDTFVLWVANRGEKIADEMLPTLFQPFERRRDRPSREGLGLGLFIASEIAKGHGGTLSVDSEEGRTAFTFRMPNSGTVSAER